MSSILERNVCPHFGVCGGCSKQHLSYSEQLIEKENLVKKCLGGFSIKNFHPILPSPDLVFYRNKMEFSFGNEKDIEILSRGKTATAAVLLKPAAHLGLHPKGRFALVTPTPECQLLSAESQRICQIVGEWATANQIPVFVRKNGTGDLRHLVIREGKNTGLRMVNLVAKSTTGAIDDLAQRLKISGVTISTFLWTRYDGLSDVAKGGDQTVFWGDGRIEEKIFDLRFKVNPDSFMQTNTHAAEMMIRVLQGWIETSLSATLIDLYCGSGAIGLSMAGHFKRIVGIEINKSAVEDAKANALLNGISNAEFIEGKAEDSAPGLPVKSQSNQTTVVVDPPRAGLHPKLLDTLKDWSTPKVFYVSCNPESLARDLQSLQDRYDILDVQPMDFFPHTDHIETAVNLSLRT